MNKNNNKVIGFTCGVLDLLHPGHLLMLKECKAQCDILVVGLQLNAREGKEKPIETFEERFIRLQGCKYVDKIYNYDTEGDLYNLLVELKPDIRFLGDDHRGKPFTGDNLPTKIIFNTRDHDYSSTNLRKRIINKFL